MKKPIQWPPPPKVWKQIPTAKKGFGSLFSRVEILVFVTLIHGALRFSDVLDGLGILKWPLFLIFIIFVIPYFIMPGFFHFFAMTSQAEERGAIALATGEDDPDNIFFKIMTIVQLFLIAHWLWIHLF